MIDETCIWIVERVRRVEHDCGSQHVVSWHSSASEAAAEAHRLQSEFDLASTLAQPGHEIADTIFDMYQQESFEKEYGWIVCDNPGCNCIEPVHRHRVSVTPDEADQALIAQLRDWLHVESKAWQIFVEDEILGRMTDPQRYWQELVASDAEVRYEVRPVMRGSLAVEERLARWASTQARSASGRNFPRNEEAPVLRVVDEMSAEIKVG